MQKMGGRFPADIEASHAKDRDSICEGGYVSDYIWAMAERYTMMLKLGYNPETVNEVYKDVA